MNCWRRLSGFGSLIGRGLVALSLLLAVTSANAAQQFQGLCSYIKIEILQELALERVGFLATLEITNNEGDAVITDFSALLTFEFLSPDAEGNTVRTDVSDKFFVQPPVLTGITSVDGQGLIEPGETAKIEWFIIPKITAGGESQAGIRYDVGAQLAGKLYGEEIDPEVLSVIPDTITVKPEPQLDITYFQPRDVDGDNPFTPDIVETPVPFTLGVLVKNVGFGQANKVTINSEQPKIVENLENLLVVPKLLGARISDEPLSGTPSLKLDLGNIPPASCKKGAWDMITTLSGEFTEFNARYTHADELGGEATSIIKDLNAYFMVREVLNDLPGRDDLWDFLATTDKSQTDLIPDTMFESDCNTVPVNYFQDPEVTAYNGVNATISATAAIDNWLFMRLFDPAQNKRPIESVVRSDGKEINVRNYWTNTRYDPDTNAELNYLNIFDFVGTALGDYEYVVTYTASATDNEAPVTTLQLSGEYEIAGDGTIYVLADTQMFFVVQDFSPVGSFFRTDSGDTFEPAYPFNLTTPGTYTLEFYSEDSQGNVENTQTRTVVSVGTYPSVTNYQSDVDEVLVAGDALSVRFTEIGFELLAATDADSLLAKAEVYQGVYAWPTLAGVPATPTRQDSAILTVAGNNVDFYQYRLNSGAWSAEAPVSQTIDLAGLNGTVNLDVRARNQRGAYFGSGEGTLSVSWVVSPTAPPINIVGPTMPSTSVDADFFVSDVDLYRYRLDNSFFRAEEPTSTPVNLVRLNEGQHTMDFIGQSGGLWQNESSATTFSWLIDRDYGVDINSSHLIYEQDLGSVAGLTQFNWNGTRQNGSPAAPGWYTVKLILTDGLNRQTSATRLVQVGDLLPDGRLLASAGTARQSEVHGRGRWVVWQDQRSGNWNVFAQDILDTTALPVEVTNTTLNQERPRSDGEYVVWQARQADGNWDIWARNLNDMSPAFAVTTSATDDEIKPVVEWPWVIYQRKSVINPSAPWQLFAKNLITDTETPIDATPADQVDPAIRQQRVVWQDHRDVGPGEIYFKDLNTAEIRRITNEPAGQYHPVIEDQWIVWADNSALQFDLYAYNLYRDTIVQLTDTPEDETRPSLNGQWLVYEEDSVGEQEINLRLMHLSNLATVQLTNAPTNKDKPTIVSGNVVWTEQQGSVGDQNTQVRIGSLPDLQPVFDNRNMVAVTEGVLNYRGTAAELLTLWQQQAGVVELTRYTQLIPNIVSETVSWSGSAVIGTDFSLNQGDFLWVKFDDARILDFAASDCLPQNLAAGINVLATACVPDDYTAYGLLEELDPANVRAVRLLDAQTGRWQVASVNGGSIIGENFTIPPIAVVLIDMQQAVNQWQPGLP